MEFGIILVPQVRDGKPEPFDDLMEQVEYAEELGYDTVWLTEHHFSPYGRAAVPALAGYAIARTSKIRVSTAVVVTPFHHPIQVAEDWATLDHLSHGRVSRGLKNGFHTMASSGRSQRRPFYQNRTPNRIHRYGKRRSATTPLRKLSSAG